jgi:hypothetical protein
MYDNILPFLLFTRFYTSATFLSYYLLASFAFKVTRLANTVVLLSRQTNTVKRALLEKKHSKQWEADTIAITAIALSLTMPPTGRITWMVPCISRISSCIILKIEVILILYPELVCYCLLLTFLLGVTDIIEEARTKPPCRQFMRNQVCEYGMNCKYSHIMFDRHTGV